MLSVISSIAFIRLKRVFQSFKALPLSLTLSVTRKCNLSCKTCNIWQDKIEDELTLDEYIKIFSSIKSRIPWITIDGGEPFLREDIDQIAENAYRYIKPRVINIATNGTLSDVISKKVSKIVRSCPGAQIIINISLDGINEIHDYIRNKPGVYARALDTYRKLKNIGGANLSLGINTTVSKFNVDGLSEIIDHCLRLNPDSYLIEMAEKRDSFLNRESEFVLSADKRLSAFNMILDKAKGLRSGNFAVLAQILRKEYYNFMKRSMLDAKNITPCLAGTASAQVFSNGDIWACCVRKRVLGNLKKAKYDFASVWYGKKSESLRREISASKCYCSSVNAHYVNTISGISITPKLILGYLAWKKSAVSAQIKRIVNNNF